MITLSKDKKFVKVNSWTEVTEINGFHEKLNSNDHKLKEIIGRYIFPHDVYCGLMNCRQPHRKGYIVHTEDGVVTNIGRDCGKTFFGVEFKELSRRFDRAVTEQNHRDAIGDFMFFTDVYMKNIESLRQGSQGADCLHAKLKSLTHKNRGCPDVIVKKINQMVRARNPDIYIEKELAEAEVRELEVIQNRSLPRPQYKEEKIGVLNGFSALYPENDLRERIILNLKDNLGHLMSVDIDSISYKDLKYWANWCSSFDKEFDDAYHIVRNGVNLISINNLSKLDIFIYSYEDQKMFSQLMKELDKN